MTTPADGTPIPQAFVRICEQWTPEPVTAVETVTADSPSTFAALLDQPSPVRHPGDELPPLWHWFMYPPCYRSDELGEDGHPKDAAFTPPLENRRRMFGGGRLTVHAPIRCGEQVTRRSSLADLRARQGGSGWLLLAKVRHELTVDGRERAVEEQDIVYREAAGAPARTAAPDAGGEPPELCATDWELRHAPSPVSLFRFSALTHNAHRIHYDQPYATDVEGHRALVVHGPLLALLLAELPRRHAPERRIVALSWRAHRPLYAGEEIVVTGRAENDTEVHLQAGTGKAASAVTGTIRLTPR